MCFIDYYRRKMNGCHILVHTKTVDSLEGVLSLATQT